MKRILFLLICFLVYPVYPQSFDSKVYRDAFRLVDIWLDAQCNYDFIPGMSVAVVQGQEVSWSNAFGFSDRERGIRAGTGTIYSICSISKLFTSVAIMHLHIQGKLGLDDEVSALLPWYNLNQLFPGEGPVTIRGLLTHSSGLPRESEFPYWTGPDFPFPDHSMIREKIETQQSLYPPSTYFQYSNLGMMLLGEIVSRISGMPYEEYIEQNILVPLRMADTRIHMPEDLWRGKLATGHSALKRDGTRDMVNFFDTKGMAPAAGFSSTVDDLARFASWQFRLLDKGGTEILPSWALRDMHRVHWVDPDWSTTWGLGFSVYQKDERTFVGHGGSCPGYRSSIIMDPAKKTAYIMMVNAQNVNPGNYLNGIYEILKLAAREKEYKDSVIDPEPFTGIYDAQPWSGETAIVAWNGKLAVLDLPAGNPHQSISFLRHVEGDTFRRIRKDDTLGEEVWFERDSNGKVIRYWQHSNYKRKIK